MLRNNLIVACLFVGSALPLSAQQHPAAHRDTTDCAKTHEASANHTAMDHAAHQAAMAACDGEVPASPGHAAFGAISEIVRMLKADPKTDWSKVNVEALRQHLIDMDHVTMRSDVVQRNVTGGLQMDVTGTGRTTLAIRRMAVSHGAMLDDGSDYHVTAADIKGGARLTVLAKDPSDARLVARIRGLGFAGVMVEGDHHARHHLAIARGEASPHAR